jgi:hypothetical protein
VYEGEVTELTPEYTEAEVGGALAGQAARRDLEASVTGRGGGLFPEVRSRGGRDVNKQHRAGATWQRGLCGGRHMQVQVRGLVGRQQGRREGGR